MTRIDTLAEAQPTFSKDANAAPALIALDWGTSSLRAYLLDAQGAVLETRASSAGIMNLPKPAAEGGFTFDLEENEASIRCVAAPVRDASGAIVAALSVASTIPYMPSERMEELIPVVQREARAISQELGWRVPQPATRRIKR